MGKYILNSKGQVVYADEENNEESIEVISVNNQIENEDPVNALIEKIRDRIITGNSFIKEQRKRYGDNDFFQSAIGEYEELLKKDYSNKSDKEIYDEFHNKVYDKVNQKIDMDLLKELKDAIDVKLKFLKESKRSLEITLACKYSDEYGDMHKNSYYSEEALNSYKEKLDNLSKEKLDNLNKGENAIIRFWNKFFKKLKFESVIKRLEKELKENKERELDENIEKLIDIPLSEFSLFAKEMDAKRKKEK